LKKLLVIFVLLSYSIASFGVSVNYGYCCGALKSVSVALCEGDACCVDTKTNGCCETKIIQVKLKKDQQSLEFFKLQAPKYFDLPALPFAPKTTQKVSVSRETVSLFAKPPPPLLPSLRLSLFSIFRI